MENLELLSKVALSFQNINEFDNDMEKVLEYIGNSTDVSRIYVFLNKTEGVVSNTFEWCNENVTSQIQNHQEFKYEDMPSWIKILEKKGYICSTNIVDLPQDIIDMLEPQKIKSILVYPMINEKEIIGFVGFDECRYNRIWTREELKILSTVSGIIANAYGRKKSHHDILASETNVRSLFETLDDMIIVSDLKGNIIEWNKSVTEKIKYTREELKDMKTSDLCPEELREETSIIMKRMVKEEIDNARLEIESKLGERYLVESKIYSGQWNKEDCIYSILKDITDREKLIEELGDKYQKLNNIIEGTKLGTWELDIKTESVSINKEWAYMLGYSREEMKFIDIKSWISLIHPEDLKKSTNGMIKHINGETEYYDCELRMKHKDGSWKWIQDRGRITQRDETGKPVKMFGTHSDIDFKKEADNILKESQKRFFLALDKTKAGLWDYDIKNNKIFLSHMMNEILGYEKDKISGSIESWKKITHPAYKDELIGGISNCLKGKSENYESIGRMKHKDGSWRWILTRGGILKDSMGAPSRFIGTNIDVTREYRQALEIESFFLVNLDLLCITDRKGKIRKTNRAWEEILGYSSEELKRYKFIEYIHPNDISETLKSLEQLGGNGEITRLINRVINANGDYRYIEWRANQDENLIYASGRDVTDQISHEKKILEISNRDYLTNLYNRRYVYDKAEEVIRDYQEVDKIFSLCIIDIDDFKKVNDRYGHQIGDYVLKEFTKILNQNMRPDDILGRYGGEEFIIILRNIDEIKSKIVVDRILEAVRNKTFIFGKERVKISFSAGISNCKEIEKEELTIDDLVNIADRRLYKAKNIGKNNIITSKTIGLGV